MTGRDIRDSVIARSQNLRARELHRYLDSMRLAQVLWVAAAHGSAALRLERNRCRRNIIGLLAVLPLVDFRYFIHPSQSVAMLEIHDVFVLPMKVVGDKGYLLVQHLEGVAYNPPAAFNSTLKVCEHCGHIAGKLLGLSRLILL